MIGGIISAIKRFFQPIRSSQYFTGIRQFNNGNYSEASEALVLIREGVYNTSILYSRLADFYYHRSLRNLALLNYYDADYLQCIINCKRALAIHPTDKVCLNYLAHSFHHVGQYSGAIQNLRELYLQESDRTDVLVNLAKVMVKADQLRDAIEILDELVVENSNYADFYLIRGIAYAKLSINSKAIENYKEAIRINPTFGKGLLLLGLEYIRDFQYEAAYEVFRHGADVCPDNTELVFYSGLVGNIIDEIKDTDFLKQLSVDSLRSGDLPESLLNDLTYLDDRVVSERLRNLDLDISYGEHFTFLNPIYDKPCLQRLINVFTELIKKQPDYADYKYKLGSFYIKLDDFENAKKYLQEALFLNPGYEDALVSLVQLYEYEEELQQADKVNNKILALYPDTGEYHLTHGRLMMKMERYEEAVSSMNTARLLDNRFNSHLYLLGFILMENGKYSLARQAWNALKRVYPAVPNLLRRLDRLEQRSPA